MKFLVQRQTLKTQQHLYLVRTCSDIIVDLQGAGPGGLGLAIALKKMGFNNITVYEREAGINSRSQGYSMTLHEHGGYAFIKRLDIQDIIIPVSTTPLFKAWDGTNNSKLYQQAIPSNRRIVRAQLRGCLIDIAREMQIDLRWNSPVEGFREDDEDNLYVTVHGIEERVDLLIAADGISSKIRSQLFGDEPPNVQYVGPAAKIKRTEETEHLFEDPDIIDSLGLHSNYGYCLFFSHHALSDEIFWSMSFPASEFPSYHEKTREDWLQIAKSKEETFKSPAHHLIRATRVEDLEEALILKDRDPRPLSTAGRLCQTKTGRVTCLGDAAHAMIPFRGAGGNNALLDAWKLSELLDSLKAENWSRDDLSRILVEYETEMHKRGQDAIISSRDNAKLFTTQSYLRSTARNVIMRGVGLWSQLTS
ncbi:2-polyprenyl-6-methoxyphenol hydroxylase-likeFAD-dependent oxidoreductase [Planoprotostelium fungivorum]|uniref:2-polyprenyl-6-methoxyphenol hydroxylase-likeFAD-dependent oxidoreductase n=1 Tax=Planoprotostelium fungivorum TaxID=1890364 RepID=A0A2P6NVV9_9EUKA|nr:2-polyprenyl-6-methoxyphenol hydroxylase-likeFAD-dependent oxidoreductase [Planoprotostelium fungivorum]